LSFASKDIFSIRENRGLLDATPEDSMANELLEGVILVLTASIFGLLISFLFRFDKLQKAIDELKTAMEK